MLRRGQSFAAAAAAAPIGAASGTVSAVWTLTLEFAAVGAATAAAIVGAVVDTVATTWTMTMVGSCAAALPILENFAAAAAAAAVGAAAGTISTARAMMLELAVLLLSAGGMHGSAFACGR